MTSWNVSFLAERSFLYGVVTRISTETSTHSREDSHGGLGASKWSVLSSFRVFGRHSRPEWDRHATITVAAARLRVPRSACGM
jgi:hypothetical protein